MPKTAIDLSLALKVAHIFITGHTIEEHANDDCRFSKEIYPNNSIQAYTIRTPITPSKQLSDSGLTVWASCRLAKWYVANKRRDDAEHVVHMYSFAMLAPRHDFPQSFRCWT